MRTPYFSKSKSLNAQIREAEQQIIEHQQAIDIQMARLVEKIQQPMIIQTPTSATLLLAGGIGFILAEISKCHCGRAGRSQTTEVNPLKNLLNLVASAQTLYAALPLAWMLRSRYQQSQSKQTPLDRRAYAIRRNRPRAKL